MIIGKIEQIVFSKNNWILAIDGIYSLQRFYIPPPAAKFHDFAFF
jgi:hypothetical protein